MSSLLFYKLNFPIEPFNYHVSRDGGLIAGVTPVAHSRSASDAMLCSALVITRKTTAGTFHDVY